MLLFAARAAGRSGDASRGAARCPVPRTERWATAAWVQAADPADLGGGGAGALHAARWGGGWPRGGAGAVGHGKTGGFAKGPGGPAKRQTTEDDQGEPTLRSPAQVHSFEHFFVIVAVMRGWHALT